MKNTIQKMKQKNISIILTVVLIMTVVASAFLLGGCSPSWSRSTTIYISIDGFKNTLNWEIREEIAQDITSFDIELFVKNQNSEWVELLAESLGERDVYRGTYPIHGLWGGFRFNNKIYSLDISNLEISYGAYKIRARSTNHAGRQSRWTNNEHGIFITSGQKISTPTNLRLVGNVLHWDSNGRPDNRSFIPNEISLPSSSIGTREHRYHISVWVSTDNMTHANGTSVSASRSSANIGQFLRRSGEITIWVWTTEAVYDFVYFWQSDWSEPIVLQR